MNNPIDLPVLTEIDTSDSLSEFLTQVKEGINEQLNKRYRLEGKDQINFLTTETFVVYNKEIINAFKAKIKKACTDNNKPLPDNFQSTDIDLLFLNTVRLKSKSVPRSIDLCYLYSTPKLDYKIFYPYNEDIINPENGTVAFNEADLLKLHKDFFSKDSPHVKELTRLYLDFSR